MEIYTPVEYRQAKKGLPQFMGDYYKAHDSIENVPDTNQEVLHS